MVRVFRKDMLVTSFLIALFIFILGFYLGSIIDETRIADSEEMILVTQLDTDSFVTEKEFLTTFNVWDCPLLNSRMQGLGEDLREVGEIISKYDARSISNIDVYNQLKRKYFLLELRAYTLRKQILQTCDSEGGDVILFFYDVTDSQESLNQGYALDSVVEKQENVFIFSIDGGFDEPAINSLKVFYNITYEPTIIINYEERIEGYISEEEILKLLEKNANM